MPTEATNRSPYALLHSKLNPPVSGRSLVQRKDLLKWMESTEEAKLVMVHAPAGFGKTTVMVQWITRLREQKLAAAWLTLDETDNDPSRFLFNLFLALRENIDGFVLADPERDHFGVGHDADGVLLYLLERLSTFEQPVTIFLEDFSIIRSPQVIDAVRRLLRYLPRGKRLVMAVRHAPDIGLAKLRARNELFEICLQDLRLSLEETGQFIRQTQKLDLDDREVEYLYQSTEGWVTGLQLSTLTSSWQKQLTENGQPTVPKAFRLICDYLVEDVLADQPEEVLEFLLKTSILNRLTGQLCDALTGRMDGYEMLNYLEKKNLFLIPLDEERHWYRYHSLFAKFLRNRLEHTGRDEVVSLHRAAYEWYSQSGEVLEAVHHALLTGDMDLAAKHMERNAFDLVLNGQAATVFEWGNRISEDILDKHPDFQFAYAYSHIYRRQFDKALEVIHRIYKNVESAGNAYKYIRHLRAAEGYVLVCQDRFDEYEELISAEVAISGMMPAGSKTGHLPVLLHGSGVVNMVAGRFEEALNSVWRASRYLNNKTLLQFQYNKYFEGRIYLTQGRLNETLELTRSTLARTETSPNRYSPSGTAVAVLQAEALYEKNELAKAEILLQEYRSVLPNATLLEVLIGGYRILARICFAEGDPSAAMRYITELERLGVQRGVPRVLAVARQERIRFAIQQGEVERALQICRDHDDESIWGRFEGRCMPGCDSESPAITRLRLMIADRNINLVNLKTELKNAQASLFFRERLVLFILLAKAQYLCGERKQAVGLLSEALLSAQEERYIRSFVDEGEPVRQMIRELYKIGMAEQARGTSKLSVAYLAQILEAAGEVAVSSGSARPEFKHVPMEPFTDREREILEKLAQGFSSQELADQLYISVHTVRYHLRSIYSKLGANSRVQAVALARRYGAIS